MWLMISICSFSFVKHFDAMFHRIRYRWAALSWKMMFSSIVRLENSCSVFETNAFGLSIRLENMRRRSSSSAQTHTHSHRHRHTSTVKMVVLRSLHNKLMAVLIASVLATLCSFRSEKWYWESNASRKYRFWLELLFFVGFVCKAVVVRIWCKSW